MQKKTNWGRFRVIGHRAHITLATSLDLGDVSSVGDISSGGVPTQMPPSVYSSDDFCPCDTHRDYRDFQLQIMPRTCVQRLHNFVFFQTPNCKYHAVRSSLPSTAESTSVVMVTMKPLTPVDYFFLACLALAHSIFAPRARPNVGDM